LVEGATPTRMRDEVDAAVFSVRGDPAVSVSLLAMDTARLTTILTPGRGTRADDLVWVQPSSAMRVR
jgi:hypothetical protein